MAVIVRVHAHIMVAACGDVHSGGDHVIVEAADVVEQVVDSY